MTRTVAVLASLLSLFSFDARAAAEQISIDRTITLIRAYGSGIAVHYTPVSDAHGCTGSLANGVVFIDLATNPEHKYAYAAALLAFSTARKVGFGVDGCYAGYGNGVPKSYRVDVGE